MRRGAKEGQPLERRRGVVQERRKEKRRREEKRREEKRREEKRRETSSDLVRYES